MPFFKRELTFWHGPGTIALLPRATRISLVEPVNSKLVVR
jgi:hypothetical protein